MGVVEAGRDAATRLLFADTGSVRRPDGDPTFDPNTGEYTQAKVLVYSGVLHLRPAPGVGERTVQVGEEAVVMRTHTLSLPHDAPDLLEGDELTMDTSQDPGLVNRSFVIRSPAYRTFAWGRQVTVEEIA